MGTSGINSADVDAKLVALSNAEDHAARVTASAEVLAAIQTVMPVSNLVTPYWHVGLSDRMKCMGYEPWGADYYVIRPDEFLHPEEIVVGQTFMTAVPIVPHAGSAGWSLTSHGISEGLFTVGKDGNIVPVVAESVSKVSEFVWDVTLKSGYKFSDGTAVTAADVVACLTELNTENTKAQASLGTMTVTEEAGKVRITSTTSTHIMESVLAEFVFVIYKKDSSDNYVFTGPYAVADAVADSHINLVPNEHYPAEKGEGAERPRKMQIKVLSATALKTELVAGNIDVAFHLGIDDLPEVRDAAGVQVASFEVTYHYMMFHNMDNVGSTADLKVRKAIDLAIDRSALSQLLKGGTGTRSLFPDNTPWYSDTSSPAGDAAAAGVLLDDAGWTLDEASGKRSKVCPTVVAPKVSDVSGSESFAAALAF